MSNYLVSVEKNAFLKAYRKNGVGPGQDVIKDAIKKYRKSKEEMMSDGRLFEVGCEFGLFMFEVLM